MPSCCSNGTQVEKVIKFHIYEAEYYFVCKRRNSKLGTLSLLSLAAYEYIFSLCSRFVNLLNLVLRCMCLCGFIRFNK